jgi:hypothetical protein
MNTIGWESRPRIGVGSRSGSNEAVLTGRKRAASYEIDRQYHLVSRAGARKVWTGGPGRA